MENNTARLRAIVHSRMDSVLQQRREQEKLLSILNIVAKVTSENTANSFVTSETNKYQVADIDKEFIENNIDFDLQLYFNEQVEIWIDVLKGLQESQAKFKFLFVLEPDPILGIQSQAIEMAPHFHTVFTWHANVLAQCPNAALFEHAGTWILPSIRERVCDIPKKQPNISFVCGTKAQTDGHRLRLAIWRQQLAVTAPTLFYVSGQAGTGLDRPRANPSLPAALDSKHALFEGSMFHLTIENTRLENYFSEKLIDALLSKTVPLYWGCPNIDRWFDTRGFIMINDNTEDIIARMNQLTAADYHARAEFIEDNYHRAAQFLDLRARMTDAITKRMHE